MKRVKLFEIMKSSSTNKLGICSMQMLIILMSVILMSSFILNSTDITLKIISKRENSIQERLWGESIFQVVDLYMIESLEKIYNKPPKSIFVSSYDNQIIKEKVLANSLFEMWSTQVSKIGTKLSTSGIVEVMGLKYKSIERTAYIYDNSPGVKYFKTNKYMVTTDLHSSDDFAMTISVKVEKGGYSFLYSKDYFLKIPLYSDELIEEIKAYYTANLSSELWTGSMKFDIEDTLITSEVYYEKT